MTNSKDYPSRAVGYIRLSTEKQASDDNEFEKQAKSIRNACERRGYELLGIYEDTASGADPLGAVRRDGLVEAVARARSEGAVLVIPEPTRLFRNVNAAKDFLKNLDIPVFSARVGRFLKAPALLRAIAQGEATVRAIKKGTVAAMTQKKAEGVEFSNSEVRQKAAKASARARSEKSDSIAMQIAIILRSDPAYRDLSHQALADLLNRRRLLTGWKREWTKDSVRAARKKAEELIADMEELEHEDEDRGLIPSAVGALATQDAPSTSPADQMDAEDEQAVLERNPFYGMF